jgi:predicted O-methyltransferase YrrM
MSLVETLEPQAIMWRENGVPILAYEKAQWLEAFISKEKPRRILELGTAVGYSGTILGHCQGKLITVDQDRQAMHTAAQLFSQHNIQAYIIEGDILKILGDLVNSGQQFDLIFVDFAKAQYSQAWEHIVRLLARDGWIISDNINNPKCADYKTLIEKQHTTFFKLGDGIALTRLKQKSL